MSDNWDERAADEAMRRTLGTELQPGVQEFLHTASDWFAYCPKCGKRREGTIEQLKAPCDNPSR